MISELEVAALVVIPPPRAISLVMKDTFICVNETDQVEFSVQVGYFGSRKVIKYSIKFRFRRKKTNTAVQL